MKKENNNQSSSSSDQQRQQSSLSKIDLNNKELIKALERLPTTEQFMTNLKQANNNIEFIIPNLRDLHNVIRELLPKPNKGLWEPQFNLDPFILSYMALLYQNRTNKKQDDLKLSPSSNNNSKEEEVKEGSNNQQQEMIEEEDDTTHQRISKL